MKNPIVEKHIEFYMNIEERILYGYINMNNILMANLKDGFIKLHCYESYYCTLFIFKW